MDTYKIPLIWQMYGYCHVDADSIMRRRMLRLLALILEKKSLHLVPKEMNCRDVGKVMEAFTKIHLSPVTISKRHDVKQLENLYSFLQNS